MVQTKRCINVVSDSNQFIDFCIIVDKEDVEKAEKIVEKAYHDYWEDDDAQFLTVADYVTNAFINSDINVIEIYYKELTCVNQKIF